MATDVITVKGTDYLRRDDGTLVPLAKPAPAPPTNGAVVPMTKEDAEFWLSEELTPTLVEFSANDLTKPTEYGRDLRPYRVERIVREFTPLAFGVPIVSVREAGINACVDGNHRADAMKQLNRGSEPFWCETYHGLCVEQEAAMYFMRQDRSRRAALTSEELFRAKLAAKDPVALAIKALVESVGYHLELNRGQVIAGINAVNQLEVIANPNENKHHEPTGRGYDKLRRVLTITRDAWGLTGYGPTGLSLKAIARFDGHYTTRQGEVAYQHDRVAQVLKDMSQDDLKKYGREKGMSEATNIETGMAMVILAHYNSGRRTNKLPKWDADPA